MTIFFCQGIGLVAELLVSIKRIQVKQRLHFIFFLIVLTYRHANSKKNINRVQRKYVQKFLLHEEKDNRVANVAEPVDQLTGKRTNCPVVNGNTEKTVIVNTDRHDVVISAVTAKWTIDQPINCLENINLAVGSGQLVAIIGPVGAGKVYGGGKKKKTVEFILF